MKQNIECYSTSVSVLGLTYRKSYFFVSPLVSAGIIILKAQLSRERYTIIFEVLPVSSNIENISDTGLQGIGMDNYLSTSESQSGTEIIDCLWRKASATQCRQGKEARVIPV